MSMRHSIRLPLCVRGPTVRRVVAARNALERERTRFALFASQVLDEQQTPEERILHHDERAIAQEQRHRELAARQWCRGRRLLMEAAPTVRREIIEAWNHSSIPAEAAYFADFIWRALRDRGLQNLSQDDHA